MNRKIMNKKGLEDSIFSWILALFIIFFVIVIMDIFAFALIVEYSQEADAKFDSGSVGMLDHQYFLNTLATTERPDYNLLDRTKESLDGFFEIRNEDGESLPQVFGLDDSGNPGKWKVREGEVDFGKPHESYGFDEGTPGLVVEIVSRIDDTHASEIRNSLNKPCRSGESNPYFFQGPFGILREENIVASTVPISNFNRESGELGRFRYSPIFNHISTYRGSDFNLRYRTLKKCFNQINTENEDE